MMIFTGGLAGLLLAFSVNLISKHGSLGVGFILIVGFTYLGCLLGAFVGG